MTTDISQASFPTLMKLLQHQMEVIGVDETRMARNDALMRIFGAAKDHAGAFGKSGIPLQAIVQEMGNAGGKGSPLFATEVMTAVRQATGRQMMSRRISPEQEAKNTYHAEAHGELPREITKLATLLVDIADSSALRNESSHIILQPAKPVPQNSGDLFEATIKIMGPKKETQGLIRQEIGNFVFRSEYNEDASLRKASIRFEAHKSTIDMTPRKGLDGMEYPETVTPITSRAIWDGDTSEKSVASALKKAEEQMLGFVSRHNSDAVARYKATPKPKKPALETPTGVGYHRATLT